ncbi:protein tyrosine phosphatase [Pelobium manganitolerans]|uniref:protein-tyrosine-phosphatase n=1 Tax=Pelobium manganitolerans TaxID=1842495 RepID=A0A419S7B1_9SPHI|nr:low molecular weight protein-tyrosine-phosphatase [Pelobium manganitolerans]RKD17046.1 protein tyrosine phosphatase [Pelobium manganitolerans]
MKILMVCLGNICRSPLAEGIMRHLADAQGLNWQVDSAGTGNYHIGKKPDHRSIKVAKAHGIDISAQQARQFSVADFDSFDVIAVMDEQNYRDVMRLAENDSQREKVRLLIKNEIVPDPYYDDALFAPVYDLIEKNCVSLLAELKTQNR